MASLAVIYVALGFVDSPSTVVAELGLTAIFALEFGVRLMISRDRRRYLRGHWIDLIALIPATRALRLLRLLRLIRAAAGLFRALSQLERLAEHRGLVWLFVVWLTVAIACSVWLYSAEAGHNASIDSPLDAIWWGIVTLTTVGYGDVYPRTTDGRIAAMVLMVVGISLYSAITATITSVLISGRSGVRDPVAELERLSHLAKSGSLTPEEYERAKAMVLG